MFESLTTRFEDVFQTLRGEVRLTPETVEAAEHWKLPPYPTMFVGVAMALCLANVVYALSSRRTKPATIEGTRATYSTQSSDAGRSRNRQVVRN